MNMEKTIPEIEEYFSPFYKPVKEAVVKAIEDIGKIHKPQETPKTDCLATGIKYLNFHNGDFVILGSRPSVGKTAFSLSLLFELSTEQNIPVGYISSGEVDSAEIGRRLISAESNVLYHKIRSGMLTVDNLKNMQEAAENICEAPFYFHVQPNITFDQLEFTAEKMVQEKKVQIIIVDSFEYLQEIVDAEKDEYRFELESLLNAFKKMAKELNIPVVLLMEMPPSEDDSPPTIVEFKKYMIIPRTADMVLFLHRERCKDENEKTEVKLNIAKNEHGRCRDIYVEFVSRTAGFNFDLEVS